MSLIDFFRINLPYGMKKNNDGTWFLFNREYVPLGWNTKENNQSILIEKPYSEFPIHTIYKGLTNKQIEKIAINDSSIRRDDNGNIDLFFLYDDSTNPKDEPSKWNNYFEKIKALSKHEAEQTVR